MRRRETEAAKVTLLPVEDEHLSTIYAWFEAPHVRHWWGPPTGNRVEVAWHRRNKRGDCRLIVAGGRPIGYIQWTDLWHWSPDETYGLPQGTIDIDLLIGEMDALGLGYGPQAVGQVIALVCQDGRPPLFSLFTSTENVHAIEAFGKAGFAKHRLIGNRGKPDSWLMTRVPNPAPEGT